MQKPTKPGPRLTTWNRPYFAQARDLYLQHCNRCGTWVFYPRAVCPACLSDEALEWRQASGEGTILSYSLVHRPQHPGFYDDVPIPLVAVQLKEGPTVISELVDADPDEIAIGLPVRVVRVPVDDENTLPKFAIVKS